MQIPTWRSAAEVRLAEALEEGLLSGEEIQSACAGGSLEAFGDVAPEAAAEICDVLGGLRCYIPTLPHEPGSLFDDLSAEARNLLLEVAGGDAVAIPRLYRLRLLVRDRVILALRQAGASTTELAQQFQCTDRAIYQVLEKHRGDGCRPMSEHR
ncbi:Mor transcription activator family protein [Aquisalimonas asiatica]|uniref:Mor transcription activator family protein n=1 Tax=Aquisalimonas asiatica TaxID=406100 RepID=UPI000B853F07|nr:Mor transcription activator family protein [Aquisalimonas asiatica]